MAPAIFHSQCLVFELSIENVPIFGHHLHRQWRINQLVSLNQRIDRLTNLLPALDEKNAHYSTCTSGRRYSNNRWMDTTTFGRHGDPSVQPFLDGFMYYRHGQHGLPTRTYRPMPNQRLISPWNAA